MLTEKLLDSGPQRSDFESFSGNGVGLGLQIHSYGFSIEEEPESRLESELS